MYPVLVFSTKFIMTKHPTTPPTIPTIVQITLPVCLAKPATSPMINAIASTTIDAASKINPVVTVLPPRLA